MEQTLKYNRLYAILLKNHLVTAFCLFVDAFLIRFAFLLGTDNLYGREPMLNIITSLHILSAPGLLKNVFYLNLPLFSYSIAAAVEIGKEQIISARFMVLILASLSLIPYYYLVKKVFNSKTALLSGILLYCFFQHIILSIITVPDAVAAGLCFLCLLMAFERRYLIAALFGLCCCAFSYLGWLLAPAVLACVLFSGKDTLRVKAVNFVCCLVIFLLFPLFWINLVDRIYGAGWLWHRNFFDTDSLYTFLYFFGNNIKQMLADIFIQPGSRFFFLAFWGVFFGLPKRKDFGYLLFILMFFLTLGLKVFRYEIEVYRPGLLLIQSLLIPYAVRGIIAGLKSLNIKRRSQLIFFVMIIGVLSLRQAYTQRPLAAQAAKQASQWLGENLERNDIILIKEDKKGEHALIAMQSGLPQANFLFFSGRPETDKSYSDGLYLVLPREDAGGYELAEWQIAVDLNTYKVFKRAR